MTTEDVIKAAPPYIVELSDEGCGECGKGRAWGVVFKPEDIAGSTTYGDFDEAEHEADICNLAFERGNAAYEKQRECIRELSLALRMWSEGMAGATPKVWTITDAALARAKELL